MKNALSLSITIILVYILQETDSQACDAEAKYRTIDGACNNLNNQGIGKSNTLFERCVDGNGNKIFDYADGSGLPRAAKNGDKLPNARLVSQAIMDQGLGPPIQSDRTRSAQVVSYGQFLSHEVMQTEIPPFPENDCCEKPQMDNIDFCFPLEIPGNDKVLPPGCLNFVRATSRMDTEGVRQQINLATPFVDASTVYGSTQELNEILRVPYSYLLKTYNHLLPTPPGVNTCFDPVKPNRCPVAGDSRVSESPMLSVQHSIWLREHNRIATELHTLNPHWNHETVYQEARKIIIAMLQHITYNDFLPIILGQTTMDRFKLFSRDVNEGVFDDSYDPMVNPQILDSVNVAAHRYGHSQLTNKQNFVDEGCNTVTVNYLKDTFESPRLVQQNNGANIPFLARHLACTASNKIDNFIVDGMRDFLLRLPEAPGSDIVARNLQRGREQGVSGYNTWREICGLEPIKSFDKFGKFGNALKELYNEPDDVDLFIGAMLEKDAGFNVGPTFQCLLGMQYQRVKRGDRFWYERPCQIFSFTEVFSVIFYACYGKSIALTDVAQLKSLKENTRISKIFCRNLGIHKIQKNMFLLPNRIGTNRILCDEIPDIDLSLWRSADVDIQGNR